MAIKVLLQTAGSQLKLRPESDRGFLCGGISVKVDFQHMNGNGDLMYQCVFSKAPFDADGRPTASLDIEGVGISIPAAKAPSVVLDSKKTLVENMNEAGLTAIAAYLTEINPGATFEVKSIK